MKNTLLVIDVQNIYTKKECDLYIKNNSKIINNINFLINFFKKNKQKVIFIKHQHKNYKDSGRMFDFSGEKENLQFKQGLEESEFDNRLNINKDDDVVIKSRYDSFIGTNLQELLLKYKTQKVTICGFMTNFCCESTARTAHDKDYFVDFIIDATGTPKTENMTSSAIIKATANTLSNDFAVIKKTKDLGLL